MVISQKELENGLELIRISYNCPSCGLPTGDLSDMDKYFCDPKRGGCGETFEIDRLNREKNKLTIHMIKELSKYQVLNTPKSSIMDKPYDEKLFTEREDFTNKIDSFMNSKTSTLFLLLGEAGFGKTWSLANIAEKLLEEYIVFYIPLRKNYKLVFNLIFGTDNISDIQHIITREISKSNLSVIWIFDGYDEMRDPELRSSFLAMCTQWLGNSTQQKIILSSRTYDWYISDNSTNDWKKQLTSMFLWSEDDNDTDSYKLEEFTDTERDIALSRYELPEFSAFDSSLQYLLRYPLWIRIIKEWRDIHNTLPDTVNLELIIHYFKRMRVEDIENRVLAELSYRLFMIGDLNAKLATSKIKSMDRNTLNNLNSSGILLYYKKIFKSEIKLSNTIFAVIGLGYYIGMNQNNYNTLKQLSQKINILEPLEIEILFNFLDYLEIDDYSLSIIKKGVNYTYGTLKQSNKKVKLSYNNLEKNVFVSNEGYDNIIDAIEKLSNIYENKIFISKIAQRLNKPNDQIIFILEDMIENKYINAVINIDDDILKLKDKWNILSERKKLEDKINKITILINKDKNYSKAWDSINEIIDNPYLANKQQWIDLKNNIQPNVIEELKNKYESEFNNGRYTNAKKYIDKILELKLTTDDEIFWNSKREEIKGYTEIKDYLGVKLLVNDYAAIMHIEELIKQKIPPVDKVETETFGFKHKSNRVIELGLYNLGITSLPESISKLTGLQTLVLNNNQITYLPNNIGNLSNLQELNLGSNNLTSLPESIGNLSNLKELNLNNNKLTKLPSSIGDLSNLQELNLGSSNLTSLPDTIGNLRNLIYLSVSNNNLTSLPDTIGNLRNLIYLYVSNNKLTSLPDTIGNLSNLIYLSVSNNKLTSLPDTIGNLSNLTYLYLYYNNLTSLPDTIGNLSNLAYLYAYYNKLTSLPDSIGNLSNLNYLYVYYNKLTSIPDTIGYLSNPKKLDLSKNKLTSLPKSIGNLKNLNYLSVSNNKLTSLPNTISYLRNLDKLLVYNNKLTSLTNSINNALTKLKQQGCLVIR